MTPEQATELRKAFPRASIGKLPKGGVMLDYVGHAATTDRLLSVDPTWTWEPFALDERGLPALDSKGNLWIRLTVCGVTRVGVGDGKSAKEVIGDAIRNAAMRFGVALDLWSKEELEGSHDEQESERVQRQKAALASKAEVVSDTISREKNGFGDPEPAAPPRTPSPPVEGGGGVTEPQLKALGASFRDADITDRDERLAYVRTTINRNVDSSKDLTKAEASKVLDALKKGQLAQPVDHAPPPDDPWGGT